MRRVQSDDTRWFGMLEQSDLLRLRQIAILDLDQFFKRNAQSSAIYSDRRLCIALCQGAAMHYIDGRTGVKDLDVWTFFREVNARPFPYRRRGEYLYGDSRFGPYEGPLAGKAVDLIGRSIKARLDESFEESVTHYLQEGRTKSAIELAKKAVVLVDPIAHLGRILWPREAGCD